MTKNTNKVNQRHFEILCLVGRIENDTGEPASPEQIQALMREGEAQAKLAFSELPAEQRDVLSHYKAQPFGQILNKLDTLVDDELIEPVGDRFKLTILGYELFKRLQGQTINVCCASFRVDYKKWVVVRTLFLNRDRSLKVPDLMKNTYLSDKAVRGCLEVLRSEGVIKRLTGRTFQYASPNPPEPLPYATPFPIRSEHGKGKKKKDPEPESEAVPAEDTKESPEDGVVSLFSDQDSKVPSNPAFDFLMELFKIHTPLLDFIWDFMRPRIARMLDERDKNLDRRIDDRMENTVVNVVEKKIKAL